MNPLLSEYAPCAAVVLWLSKSFDVRQSAERLKCYNNCIGSGLIWLALKIKENYTFPLVYEYYGLILHFHTNDHDCVCVNARSGAVECWAELEIEDGNVISATIRRTLLRAPLFPKQMEKFKKVLGACPNGIYEKWRDFFIRHKNIRCEGFDFKIDIQPSIPVIDAALPEPIDWPVVSLKSSTYRYNGIGVFNFSDGRSAKVDFNPFFESCRHSAVKARYNGGHLASWVLEGSIFDSLGWPHYLISFSLNDLYEGLIE